MLKQRPWSWSSLQSKLLFSFASMTWLSKCDLATCVGGHCGCSIDPLCACVHVCLCAKSLHSCDSLWPYGRYATWLLCPWNSPGKNTRVGCHALLQGIFLIQGLDLCLMWFLHCRQILYHWATREAHRPSTKF